MNQRGDHHLAPEPLINQRDAQQLNKDAAEVVGRRFACNDSAKMLAGAGETDAGWQREKLWLH